MFGQWWTTVNPATVSNFRLAAGLYAGNTGEYVAAGTIVSMEGATITAGGATAGPFGGGGIAEVVFSNPAASVALRSVTMPKVPF